MEFIYYEELTIKSRRNACSNLDQKSKLLCVFEYDHWVISRTSQKIRSKYHGDICGRHFRNWLVLGFGDHFQKLDYGFSNQAIDI